MAVVVALNVAARLDQPGYAIDEGYRSEDAQYQIIRLGPGGAVSGVSPAFTLQEAEDAIYSRNLDRLQLWSIVSVVGLALASGIGGYVLSGMMLRPVRDITRVASQISATDLSHRINHQGPEDELKELADTFDSMIDRLEQSFEQQRQFVQDASHELRTPLAAIRTNIEVAELDADLQPDEVHDVLETIKLQTERLTRLTEDLLLLSSSERQMAEREPIHIHALATEVVRQLAPLAMQRKVRLGIDGDKSVAALGTADHLYRCVFNLVDNSIKYSGEGSSVTIRWSAAADGQAKVTVADTGPGIPLDAQEHIFDRFYRVEKSRSRREGGLGLGLAIVKELVESMGGKVSLVSAPGEGSAFTLTLPVAAGQPAETPEASAAPV
ncbi:MAG TPA: HAMP domain-containing sensor histidine kinase [Tepidiformaceae bacterium]|nr:HAMP domain-containing sensor histidine kinase [Tepidiformaceae bacterium]